MARILSDREAARLGASLPFPAAMKGAGHCTECGLRMKSKHPSCRDCGRANPFYEGKATILAGPEGSRVRSKKDLKKDLKKYRKMAEKAARVNANMHATGGLYKGADPGKAMNVMWRETAAGRGQFGADPAYRQAAIDFLTK